MLLLLLFNYLTVHGTSIELAGEIKRLLPAFIETHLKINKLNVSLVAFLITTARMSHRIFILRDEGEFNSRFLIEGQHLPAT